jgi:hypothetical protein
LPATRPPNLFFFTPHAPIVLSVEDNGTVEFQLFFSR